MGRTGELTVNNKVYNGIMPPQNIDDTQAAAVLTYVYKKFLGKDIAVTADEVKKVRAGKK